MQSQYKHVNSPADRLGAADVRAAARYRVFSGKTGTEASIRAVRARLRSCGYAFKSWIAVPKWFGGWYVCEVTDPATGESRPLKRIRWTGRDGWEMHDLPREQVLKVLASRRANRILRGHDVSQPTTSGVVIGGRIA
jgi:hypothetical protein